VLAVIGSVIGAFYYIKIVKIMFFDEPADTVRGRSDWAHWTLLIVSTVAISPLAFLVTGWLSQLASAAAAALSLGA
jgi:NADH-quinone oxidoreductase subunit N